MGHCHLGYDDMKLPRKNTGKRVVNIVDKLVSIDNINGYHVWR